MHRVMRGDSGVIATPKQKRLSVGFGTSSSVQIHATATPPNNLMRSDSPTLCTPPDRPKHHGPEMMTPGGRQMSMHETLLLRILSTPSDLPLLRRGSSDATPSQRTADDSFDSCLSGSNTPTLDLLTGTPDAMRCSTPPAADGIVHNRHLQMLYRDLNSPSATARLRALRALKSPTKRNAYANFDVSYAEQDIITAEERMEPTKRDIRDVLRDVCVYVEVRSGTDNRSDGIKEHVASLGAKVNERLLKDTTHVIFKDGLLSTYQKAKKMNVPVVSVLWIEACKRHTCLMNPEDFKISNVERYENPDLFKRIRRQKSMQPGAEETIGNKRRTAPTGKAKVAPVVSPPSKLPVLHRIRKDDQLERILNDFEADNQITSDNNNAGPVDEYDEMLQAAPMRMLERFRSTPTPLDNPTPTSGDNLYSTPEPPVLPVPDDQPPCHDLFAGSVSGSKRLSTSRARRKTILFTPQMTNLEEEVPVSSVCMGETQPKELSLLRGRRKTIVACDNDTSPKTRQNALEANTKGGAGRRKTILNAEEEYSFDVAVDSTVTTPARRTRRSSMVTTGNEQITSPVQLQLEDSLSSTRGSRSNRRKTIVASKENISPSLLRTSMADGDRGRSSATSSRGRRKTVAFGVDENTPPTAHCRADAKNLSNAKLPGTRKRGTIFSPKAMDVSLVPEQTKPPVAVVNLTKKDSRGSEMNVSSRLEHTPAIVDHRRRRTLFNPSTIADASAGTSNESPESSPVVTISSTSVTSDRRQTLFNHGNSTFMDPLEVSETPPEPSRVVSRTDSTHNNGSSICDRPDPTSTSTPKPPPTAAVPTTANARRKTLLEEYGDTLLFSSTRAPAGRRRTIFDISMDIMDHRLSEINRQAAVAKRPPGEDNPVIAPTNPVQILSSPPPADRQKSLDEFYRKAIRSCEKQQPSKTSDQPTIGSGITTEKVAVAPPRKRKLFNVQSSEEQPSPKATAIASNAPKSTNGKTVPRRRSLVPTSIGCTVEPAPVGQAGTMTKSRRTTALFESPHEPPEGSGVAKKKTHFPVGRGLPTMASQYNHGCSNQQPQVEQGRQYLATTNLHTEQAAFVKEAIEKLDGFIIEPDVTDNTTHLVTLEPRRTVNMLRALVRGLWIVRYDWIAESFRACRWLPEEQFEVRDFSPAVQINRSERQAFGSQYRSELFADYGPFWISPRCAVPVRQMRELLLLCRGKVTGSKLKAKYLVLEKDDDELQCPSEDANGGQVSVTALWILDSITANKVKKLSTIA